MGRYIAQSEGMQSAAIGLPLFQVGADSEVDHSINVYIKAELLHMHAAKLI